MWNFTLKPGEMTSMHRHDYDYTFVVVQPSQLEVFGENGSRLFDFWAAGTKAFRIKVSKFFSSQKKCQQQPDTTG